jgi:NAD(P)H-dependent FMN reductase
VAYIATTFLTVVFAVVAQGLVNRVGTRVVLPVGLAFTAVAVLLYTRLPVNGSYVPDLLPGFLLTGVGLGLAFVPDSIAALTGTRPREAGAASGRINTSQQIGGAVGLAAITTIATTATSSYLHTHLALGVGGPLAALTHGFHIAFFVLAGVLALAAVLAALFIASEPATAAARAAQESDAAPAPAGAGVTALGPRPVRVLGLVAASAPGAGRRSYHRGLFRAAQEQAPAGMTIDEFDVAALPAYPGDGSSAADAEPVQVVRLRHALRHAEAILVATPQDDADIGVALKNAFAWAAGSPDGRQVLAGKPLGIMGSSCDAPRLREAQAQMRDVLGARQSGEGDEGARVIWSCVRGDSHSQRPTHDARASVQGLLAALAEVTQPSEQAA